MGGIVSGITDTLGLTGSDSITDKFFGNNIPNELKNPRLTSFTSPGFNAKYNDPQNLEVTRSQSLQDSLSSLSGAFSGQASELGQLKGMVQPGFGRLTQAGINAIRDARRSTMGDLKQNLARRRVAGSSFGADDQARTSAEFAKRENEFASQAFVQEMAMTQDLINQQAQADAKSFATWIDQANLETGFATTMATGVSAILSQNAKIIGDMSNAGANALLGTIGNVAGIGAGLYGGSQGWFSPGYQGPGTSSGLGSGSPGFSETAEPLPRPPQTF